MAKHILWVLFFLEICFTNFGSGARLLPKDEVKSLQIISKKLNITLWKNINQKSCIIKGSLNHLFANVILSNVTCDCSYNQGNVCHVTNIQLKSLNLTGVVPEEFGNLSKLQELDFSRNELYGTIPKSLSRLPLVTLSIYGNLINGSIPKEIGQITTLEHLVLEDNQLGGTLPSSLGNLKNLKKFVVAGNNITGRIPETFGNLKNLTILRINGNSIYGKIPDFLGNLTSLSILDMQGTSMEGPIPSSLLQLNNLTILRLSDLNTTSMTFPNLKSITLHLLVLRNCFITGPIPDFIQNFINLKLLDLSYNQLTGPIPDIMQTLPKLSFLFLTNNSLTGPLPGWISNSKHTFDVSYNNFTSSSAASCQQSNVNLVASCSSQSNPGNWCLMKDLPCPISTRYHSLFINCGGRETSFDGNTYEDDSSPGGPSNFFASNQTWAYSSTGSFFDNDDADFQATYTSNPNVTSIYQTARLAPISLKYFGLCLQQGSYNVKLHFAEIMFTHDRTFTDVGRRFFDVSIQGNMVLKDFNIAEEAGGNGKEIIKEFNNVYVNGTTLEIYLYWAGKGTTQVPNKNSYGPLISGITVTLNFKVSHGLSAGAISGIVVASCSALMFALVFLRMKGYLGGRKHDDGEFQGLYTGYFSLRQIKTATDNFDFRNKLGEGGFGPVYKGVLSDGRAIAVKQLSANSRQGNREFVNEIGMLSGIQHSNLVKLYGCCVEGKELLLVYEYMENNSLSHALFGKEEQKLKLDWQTRKKICLGVARGLAYLHEESRLKIVHRDIKATNVLLDKDLNAKISDFGLAKLDEGENTHISTRIAGTIGYMAPEYAMRGYLTDKADIYSFGVVVLEIVSGKSNTSYRPREDSIYLLDWVYVLQEQGNILEVVDPNLGSNYPAGEALRLLNLALLCTNPTPTLRPTMSSIVSMIDGKLPIQPPIPNRKGTNKELRSKSFGGSSHDSQTQVTWRSSSSHVPSHVSMDDCWTGTSISMQSMDEARNHNSLL